MALVIDTGTAYQVFDGASASPAQSPLYSDAEADLWFGPSGVGLSLARFNIDNTGHLATAPWTTPFGTSPGDDLSNAIKFSQHGAKITLMTQLCPSAWTTPVGSGYSLLASHYADLAAYLTTALNQCADNGVSVYAVQPHNEPDNQDVYGLYFTASQYFDWVHNYVRPAIAASKQPGVKLVLGDLAFGSNLATYLAPFSGYASDYDFVAHHTYAQSYAKANVAQRTWMTETGHAPADYSMATDGLWWANQIQAAIVTTSLSSFWMAAVEDLDWLQAFASQNGQGLASGYNYGRVPRKRAYVFGQWNKALGCTRVAATGAPSGVSASAWAGPGGNRVIIAINNNGTATQLDVSGLAGCASVTPWVTDATRNLAQLTDAALSGGTFSYQLPAQSVVSFVGAVNQVADTSSGMTSAASSDANVQSAGRLTLGAGPVVNGVITLNGYRVPGSTVTVTVG